MRMKKFSLFIFVAFTLLATSSIWAEQTRMKEEGKGPTPHIPGKGVSTFPVSGAKVRIFLEPKTFVKECVTDQNGEFSLSWEEINNVLGRGRPETGLQAGSVKLLFEVTPPTDFQYLSENKTVSLILPRLSQQKSLIRLVLCFSTTSLKTNKGAFIINPKMDSG